METEAHSGLAAAPSRRQEILEDNESLLHRTWSWKRQNMISWIIR